MKDQESPKESLRILNSREKKEINRRLSGQWGCEIDKELVFMLSNKDKLYLADSDIGSIEFKPLKIDGVGLYACTVTEKDIRLSIEGSQMLGPKATKNVLEISRDDVKQWFRGLDLEKEVKGVEGFVILRCGKDFVGCGKVTDKGIMNFVPKTRRILGGG